MADLPLRRSAFVLVLAGTYAEAIARTLLEEIIPFAVIGMFGGLLAAFRQPRPARSFVLLSIGRSSLVGFAAAQILIGLGVNRAFVLGGTVLASYIAEELLTGFAKIAGSWADQPLHTLGRLANLIYTMRAVRGLPEPDEGRKDASTDRVDR